MARARASRSIPKSVSPPGRPRIFAEGKHDYTYLSVLAESGVILPYTKGTKLQASEIKHRIEAIKKDLINDAIDCVIWIVDGGDQHIKKSKDFINFYKEWLGKKDGEWKSLHILINAPCLEYWFLLHRTDPPLKANTSIPINFKSASDLLESSEFKKHCKEGKGANLVRNIAINKTERKLAIKRAKQLGDQLINLADKNLFDVARAELYQVFKLMAEATPISR